MISHFKTQTPNNSQEEPVKISAIVTAFDREEMTWKTIRVLQDCTPPPEEILVHFDHGAEFPLPCGSRALRSIHHVGPGGARNRLIREAKHEWIASFDDDSFPMEPDFFLKLSQAIKCHLEVGVLACVIRHRNPEHDSNSGMKDREVASFIGCGCVYRKSAFQQTSGYLALPVAYGIEEVDVALQMHDKNLPIIECPSLKVFHDTHLSHHQSPLITAGAVKNQALLFWLRYPVLAFPLGFMQWLNKIKDSLVRGRWIGAAVGVLETPLHIWKHRRLRRPLSRAALKKFRRLSRR